MSVRRCIPIWTVTAVCMGLVLLAVPARAGNHVEVTWLPMREFTLQSGPQTIHLKLPTERSQPASQAVLLVSNVQPTTTRPADGKRPASAPSAVVVRIKSGGKALPPWTLRSSASGYLINLATIAANPGRGDGELWLEIELEAPGATGVSSLGTPDVLAASTDRDGPLEDYAAALPAGPARDYFDGLRLHMNGDMAAAAAKYAAAAAGSDERIARIARRAERIIRYQKRPTLPDNDFAAHRRSALYLQTCGFFALAFGESANIGGFDIESSDAWFHLGELAERLGWPLTDVTQGFGRSGYALDVQDPVEWYALVIVLAEEEISGQKLRLTPEQVQSIYSHWFNVEQMVIGASGGAVQIRTHYLYVANKSVQPYALYGERVYGPTDEVFPVRGAYDSVISIRPLGVGRSAGPDLGPNGAALSDLSPASTWEDLLAAWTQHFEWACRAGEAGIGFPPVADTVGCGVRPLPSVGAGPRAALRYYATPATFRKVLVASPRQKLVVTSMPSTQPASQSASELAGQWKYHVEPSEVEFLRRWKIEGPYEIDGPIAADDTPGKHVLDPFPPPIPMGGPGSMGQRVRTVESATDFVDLKHELGNVHWGLARASCWVYSPQDQFVQVWLGHNDGMALWVNGQCVHRGDYYAANRWEDKDLTDMVMAHAILHSGWNRVQAVIESWPAPRDKGWGFSLRFAGRAGKPLVGLAYRIADPPEAERAAAWKPPQAGSYYNWADVKIAYHEFLPQLTDEDLARFTGVPGLTVQGAVGATTGYTAIGVPGGPAGERIRALPAAWNAEHDVDWTLNNVLDWSREDVCAYPFEKAGQRHALLLLRPEAIGPYLELLVESPEARRIFGNRKLQERTLGWMLVGSGESARSLLIVDTALGDPKAWPIDEEDLLGLPGPTPPKPAAKWGVEIPPKPAAHPATASSPAGR